MKTTNTSVQSEPFKSVVSRRTFLQDSAIAASGLAIPTIISSRSLAKPGQPGPNDRVTIGFIGCGRQTVHKNIPLFMRTPGVEPLAVCDVDSWRIEKALEQMHQQYDSGKVKGQFGKVDSYVDYQDLLARDDIDTVCIGTPDHWHLRMTLDSMKAGKDVALEKPIARSIRDSQRYIEAAKKYQRVFRVDTEFRSGYGAHRATWLARNGYLGKIVRVEVLAPIADKYCPPQKEMPVPEELDYGRWLGDAPAKPYTEKRVHPRHSFERPGWFSMLDYADGVITNFGAHLNSGAMWATNKERTGPVEISGTGSYLPADSFYDTLAEFDITYQFADGLEWRYRTSGNATTIRIIGEEGWVKAGFGNVFDAENKSLLTIKPKPSDEQFSHMSEKQDFINCVRSRDETMEPPEVGHRINSIGKLGQISVHLDRPLRWDPVREEFPDDPEAAKYIDSYILRRPENRS